MKDIRHELMTFFDIHHELGTFPGGTHLEMTSGNVTECLDMDAAASTISPDSFLAGYKTTCDPRLSASQSLEIRLYRGSAPPLTKS